MLSQTAEYALRAVVWLAAQSGKPQTTAQIAQATRVPAGYLAKVLQILNRAGLVNAQRGLGGGFTLARGADSITALDVVQAVEPISRITSCPLGIASHGQRLCPLHRRLDQVIANTIDALGTSTIAEIVAEPTGSPALCDAAGDQNAPGPQPEVPS